jgi:hypothetical protein
MSERFVPPKHGEDCVSQGKETRDVSYQLTLEQMAARSDDALAREEAAAIKVLLASTELKAAKEAEKRARQEAQVIREENRMREEIKPGLVEIWHDYRDKARYPLGRKVVVRVGGSQDGEVVEEFSRPLTKRESQTNLELPLTVEDEKAETIRQLTEAIGVLVADAGDDGVTIYDLLESAMDKGIEVNAPTVRALVEASDAWVMVGVDRVALASKSVTSEEPPAEHPDDATTVLDVAIAILRQASDKGLTVKTISAKWPEGGPGAPVTDAGTDDERRAEIRAALKADMETNPETRISRPSKQRYRYHSNGETA